MELYHVWIHAIHSALQIAGLQESNRDSAEDQNSLELKGWQKQDDRVFLWVSTNKKKEISLGLSTAKGSHVETGRLSWAGTEGHRNETQQWGSTCTRDGVGCLSGKPVLLMRCDFEINIQQKPWGVNDLRHQILTRQNTSINSTVCDDAFRQIIKWIISQFGIFCPLLLLSFSSIRTFVGCCPCFHFFSCSVNILWICPVNENKFEPTFRQKEIQFQCLFYRLSL